MQTISLTPNMEDYLEAIFYLRNLDQVVRVRAIAEQMKVKMPSVSDALKILQSKKLVRHEPYGHVELTAKGEDMARALLMRHQQLTHFFHDVLGVDSQTAEEDACRIEHVVSPKSMQRLLALIDTIETCDIENCFIHKNLKNLPAAASEIEKRAETRPPGLHTLEKGRKAVVVEIADRKSLRRRLLDQGFTLGAEVEMENPADADGALSVKVKGYRLTLKRRDAERVKIAPYSLS